jgi:hypothetical protein
MESHAAVLERDDHVERGAVHVGICASRCKSRTRGQGLRRLRGKRLRRSPGGAYPCGQDLPAIIFDAVV